MGIKRIVDIGFWNDNKVIDFFSPEDRYFMLYLLTNPHTTQLGIYEYNKRIMAFELGYSLEAVTVLLDRFENKYGIIIQSKETNELAILNYLRYSIITGGKPVEDLLNKEIKRIKNKELIFQVAEHVLKYEEVNVTVEKVCIELLKEKSSKKENILNDNDNDNDNDNEKSYPKSYNDSYNDSYNKQKNIPSGEEETTNSTIKIPLDNKIDNKRKTKKSQVKHKHIEEFEMLWEQYPNKKGKDKAQSEYIKARENGTSYEEVEKGIQNYIKEIKVKGTQKSYIKHGATWFRNKCWQDEYHTQPDQQNSRGVNNGINQQRDKEEILPGVTYL